MFLKIDDVVVRVRRPYHSVRGSVPVTLVQGAETTSALSTDNEFPEGMRLVPEQQVAVGFAPPSLESAPEQRFFDRIRAWMVVLPTDALLLIAPILWTPSWSRRSSVMAALSVLLLNEGRYRARLHLSVLDELPTLASRILIAAAIIATVIALRPRPEFGHHVPQRRRRFAGTGGARPRPDDQAHQMES
jgi:hypothetical protein